ncbi:hypothetical protein NDU88_002368 [Pleurodeles waltl]|uniref:Uncharacterized protein n=1 Tax=Pleurodeles waltl TaxID=8319 RepID=A0AAV7T216_PLEWA|nr:hypothetical protein NDU88_002368 [Pleurodeles waltl]
MRDPSEGSQVCTGKKARDPNERSQGHTGEKTWDPSRNQRKSPTRENPRTEEDGYARRPGEPKETATPHSWRSMAKQGTAFVARNHGLHASRGGQ